MKNKIYAFASVLYQENTYYSHMVKCKQIFESSNAGSFSPYMGILKNQFSLICSLPFFLVRKHVACEQAPSEVGKKNSASESECRDCALPPHQTALGSSRSPAIPKPNREPHSGQTTGHSREHARDLSTSGQFPSSSHKIPRSTCATRAISVLSLIILPLQTFFSRVLLLRQQAFSSENLPPERPTTTITIKTQVFTNS